MNITSPEIINLIKQCASIHTDVFLQLRSMPAFSDYGVLSKQLHTCVIVLLPGEIYPCGKKNHIVYAGSRTSYDETNDLLFMDVRELFNEDTAVFIQSTGCTNMILPFYECADTAEYGYKMAYGCISDLRSLLPRTIHITGISRGDHLSPSVFEALGTADYILAGEEYRNLVSAYCAVSHSAAMYSVADQCEKYPLKKIIVECTTRSYAESLNAFLFRRNTGAVLFHGGRTKEQNSKALEAFTCSDSNILIATKSLVPSYPFVHADKVLYFGLPYSVSHADRCASLGSDGRLTCIYSEEDIQMNKRIVKSFQDTLGIDDPEFAKTKEIMQQELLTIFIDS